MTVFNTEGKLRKAFIKLKKTKFCKKTADFCECTINVHIGNNPSPLCDNHKLLPKKWGMEKKTVWKWRPKRSRLSPTVS